MHTDHEEKIKKIVELIGDENVKKLYAVVGSERISIGALHRFVERKEKLQAVDCNEKKTRLSRRLKVSRMTIYRLLKGK